MINSTGYFDGKASKTFAKVIINISLISKVEFCREIVVIVSSREFSTGLDLRSGFFIENVL